MSVIDIPETIAFRCAVLCPCDGKQKKWNRVSQCKKRKKRKMWEAGWVHIRRYSGDFFINGISALYWSKVVGPANWCSVTHFTNINVFKIRQGCTKAAITQKEREALEEKLNEIWVRFPYNPIHLLCMQHFHTFSHKYFSLTRVETCMQKKSTLFEFQGI